MNDAKFIKRCIKLANKGIKPGQRVFFERNPEQTFHIIFKGRTPREVYNQIYFNLYGKNATDEQFEHHCNIAKTKGLSVEFLTYWFAYGLSKAKGWKIATIEAVKK